MPGALGHHEGKAAMNERNSPGPVVAPARPRVSLRCGPWNAHQECPGEFCQCPCHEVPGVGEGSKDE